MNLKLRIIPAALALGALSLATAAQGNTLKIGIPQPMTGPNTQYGDQIQAGALTAIDALNEKGGIKGMKIEPLLIDDGWSAASTWDARMQTLDDIVARAESDGTLNGEAIGVPRNRSGQHGPETVRVLYFE